MAQVPIRHYSMDPLVHTLSLNTRRRPLIGDMCDDNGALAIKIAAALRSFRSVAQHLTPRQAERRWYEDYCHVYTFNEGNDRRGGFAVLNGELIALHHIDRGLGDWCMRWAIKAGARSLSCIGTEHLLTLYKRHGFVTVSTCENTDVPPGPVVHYMEYQP